MNGLLLTSLGNVKELFYGEMSNQTSACLFGSAATDTWVPARSDLDLIVVLSENQIPDFGQKVLQWEANTTNPLLDGFALYLSNNVAMAKRLEDFSLPGQPMGQVIPLIDRWNVKNRSKHLFGVDVKEIFPEISQDELRNWAVRNIESDLLPTLRELVVQADVTSDARIPLKKLVWVASNVSRMLMLTKGIVCSSKLESLHWLAEKSPEIREMINLLIQDYEKHDNVALTFDFKQVVLLGKTYVRLLAESAHVSR